MIDFKKSTICAIILFSFCANAQTYFWNNLPTTTNSILNWTPAPNNGGGTN